MPSDNEPVFVPAPELPPGPRYALVIATSRYDDPAFQRLRSPVRDAADFADVLADPDIGDFEVTTLVDPTDSRIRREIAAFLHVRKADETLLIYLSCHGIQDPRGRLYFAATDTIKDSPLSAVKSADVIEALDECKAGRQILIVDCCFSGSFGDKAGSPQSEPNLEQHLPPRRGREVLTASRRFEYSFEGKPLEGVITGSVFTTGLVEGLRTGAADNDGDGYITVREAYEYAFEYVGREGSPQTPQHFLSSGEGKGIVFARSAAGRAIYPARLPENWIVALDDGAPELRIGAVNAIADWLSDPDPARVIAAKRKLRHIAANDIRRVADVATRHLELAQPAEEAAPAPRKPAKRVRSVKNWSSTPTVVLTHDRDGANCAAFSPDGQRLASAGEGRAIQLWEVATGSHMSVLNCPGKGTSIRHVAFSPDGALLASAGNDNAVRLLNVESGRQIRERRNDDTAYIVQFSPDGKLLASGHMGGKVGVWTVPDLKRWREVKASSDTIVDLAFSPSGTFLSSAGQDGMVRVYAEYTQRFASRAHAHWATGVAFSPDGTLLASSDSDGMVKLYEPETGRQVRELQGEGHINGVRFSRDGRQLAVGYHNGNVGVWELDTGQQQILAGHAGPVNSVAFSPADRLLASASKDGTVRLWR
jgi:WD40 repeat protein